MCLWLLTACLGVLPNPAPRSVLVVQAVPAPILTPTTTTTTTTTTVSPPLPGMTNPGYPAQTMPPYSSYPPPSNPSGGGGSKPPMSMPTAATMYPYTNPPHPPSNVPTGGVILPVLICADPNVVCVVANPDQPVAGSPMIDPRLGYTPQASAAYQIPITGYSAQLPSYDTAVRFPRERRSVESVVRAAQLEGSARRLRRQASSCSCVAAGTCPINNGAGMIDFRIVTPGASGNTCPAGQVWCCVSGGGGGTQQSLIACGTRQAVTATVVASSGQADFGEYPWMAIILTNQNDYIAGGVLIDQYNVLTVIHRLSPYIVSGAAPNVKVRLGEWDAAGTYEPIPSKEFTVRRVFTHPSFNAQSLQYDIAVLRLATPVPITPMTGATTTINRACLPTSSAAAFTGQRCWVTGWGKSAFGPQGQYQQILKEVDVPIVDPNTCQNQLQTARLGASYVLDTTSFVCAGGEPNKDSCTGDGGSGLVCQVNGQWTLVGLVSWGLGCANSNVPGVYVNVAALLPWIQQQVATT